MGCMQLWVAYRYLWTTTAAEVGVENDVYKVSCMVSKFGKICLALCGLYECVTCINRCSFALKAANVGKKKKLNGV